jgi:hypothetical protein
MKTRFCLSILALAFLELGNVHAQTSPALPIPSILPPPTLTATISPPTIASPAPGASTDTQQDNDTTQRVHEGVSSWLAYPRWAGCCCRVGHDGPIDMELYGRSGVSAFITLGLFGRTMHPGWDVEGGVRSLFFNTAETAAWTVDLGITNTNYNTEKKIQTFILRFRKTVNGVTTTVPVMPITPTGLNNTTLNLAVGREWYLFGSTHDCASKEFKWRVGCDGGGRWGSNEVDLVEIQHKTSNIHGFYFSVHTDVEVPCGCAVFFTGLRSEFGYLVCDILQKQNNTEMYNVNATVTVGIRY